MELMKHQEKALAAFRTRQNKALFYPMGTGKTLPTILYIKEFLKANKTVLVVSQKFVSGVSWPEELEKWAPELEYINIVGKAKKTREKLLKNRKGKITLMSFGALKPVGELYRNWDLLIVDEASGIKDTSTLRHRCLKYMNFEQIILLTGTPTPNGLHEIWGLMSIMGYSSVLGKSKTDFLLNYFYVIRSGNIPIGYKPLTKYVPKLIYNKVKNFCLVAKKPEIPTQYINLNVELDKKIIDLYRQLENELALEIGDNDFVLANNKAVLINKLRQLTSGNIFDMERKSHKVHEIKNDRFKEFIENADENVLIWYAFTAAREAIIRTCKSLGVSYTTSDINGWNKGKYKAFIAHPQSFGYGMNMQAGGRIILWYDLIFSSSQYEQANARLARKGQEKDVLIYHLICKDTVDEIVLKCLKRKKTEQDFFIDLWREKYAARECTRLFKERV